MKRLIGSLATFAALVICLPAAAPAAVAPAPAWSINSIAVPTNFEPGGEGIYEVRVENIGAEETDGTPLTITDVLPAGVTVDRVELPLRSEGALSDFGPAQCGVASGAQQTVTCTVPAELPGSKPAQLGPSEFLRMIVYLDVSPVASGQLTNEVEVQGGGAPPANATSRNEASTEPAAAGFQEFSAALLGPDGRPQREAGSHPFQYTTSFAVNTVPGTETVPFLPAEGDIKDVEVKLPPGLVGNPTAVELCRHQQFNSFTQVTPSQVISNCPDGSAVGFIVVRQLEGKGPPIIASAIYNLVPTKGMPAQFGFQVGSIPFYIDTSLRTGDDYGISAHVRNTSQLKRVTAASVTIWGNPSDPRHNSLRGACLNHGEETKPLSLGSCAPGPTSKPFLRLPTSCEEPLRFVMSFNRWNAPNSFLSRASTSPATESCAPLDFAPTLTAQPSTTVADSPSGLRVNLHLPQNEDVDQLATADLRDLTVTLPRGVSVNPSSAAGLVDCTPAQLELDGPGPAQCPDASKIGTVEVHTPLLDHPVKGAVYVASQEDNPFNSLIAIYVTAHDPQTGVVLKLAGKVEPDVATGQLKTTFVNNPQLPFEDLETVFFSGPRAPLRTPSTCGKYTTTTSMTPWSAPASGPDATPSDSFTVTTAPGGGPCAASEAAQPHHPAFEAGTLTPQAAAYTPFVAHLRRADASQTLRGLNITLPPGLVGKLAGIPYCPQAFLRAATARSGRAELASPSCSPASQVGTVTVGAGAGPSPLYVQGRAYLAGPYKGAPLSMAIVTPAVAGPFDLGTVVVMAALRVNPRSAQVTAVSDPFPTILKGIPLDVRSVSVRVDRPSFILNPTNCEPMSIQGEALSLAGRIAPLGHPFRAGGCQGLGFKPRLFMRLFGGTRRGAHPKLRAVLLPREGQANIGRAAVSLPRSQFLDQANIRTICTRVQFAADACPKGSIYGRAVAHSPLLDEPLSGPLYLRSSNNPLPDLVVTLRGQIEIELGGRIDSIRSGIRTTFETPPDAPVSKFVLHLRGGKRGLLVNSRNICAGKFRAFANFKGQNGAIARLRPKMKNSRCAKKSKRQRSKRSSHRPARR